MSDLPARTTVAGEFATTAGVAAGVAVTGVLMACLLHPEAGRYVSEAVALVCAMGVAGVAVFVVALPADLDVTGALRRLTTWLAVTGFAAALVTLPFAVMAVSDDGIRGLGDSLARSAALRGGDYETVVARGAGLVLIVGAWRARTSARMRVALLLGAALVVGSFLLTGHARTHGPRAAVLATAFVHVGAAATWIGGLLALALTVRSGTDPHMSARLLGVFSRTMRAVLALLLAAGIGLAILYLSSPAALVRTAYGEVLLVKLAIVASVLVYSTANHFRLVPAAESGNMRAVSVLRANIAAEQILVATVLVVTEILSRQNPGT